MPVRIRVVTLLATLLVLLPGLSSAAWEPNGVLVSPLAGSSPRVVPDGSGGVYVAWRSDAVRVQRLTAAGDVAAGWPADGVLVTALVPDPRPGLFLAADPMGGVFVGWKFFAGAGVQWLSTHVYVQSIDASSTLSSGWPADGVRVDLGGVATPRGIEADGFGGVFVAWDAYVFQCSEGFCSPPNPVSYVSRFNAIGGSSPGWPVLLASHTSVNTIPIGMARDPATGTNLVAWEDPRPGQNGVFVVELTPGGLPDNEWPAGGLKVIDALGGRIDHAFSSDSAGGAFLCWADNRNEGLGYGVDLYAQHVRGDGTIPIGWPAAGVPLAVEVAAHQRLPRVVPDESGGAYFVWQDTRSGTWKLYAQRLGAAGQPAPGWPEDGIALVESLSDQQVPAIVADGAGGFIVAWHDARVVEGRVYALRVTGNGSPAPGWPADGAALTLADHAAVGLPDIAAVATGEAVVVWAEDRFNGARIRAQRIVVDGVVPTTISLARAVGAPGRAILRWYAPTQGGRPVAIERTVDDIAWDTRSTVIADRDGGVAYEDRAVQPGRRYGYRMVVVEIHSETAWITIPRVSHFGIERIDPNPAQRIANLAVSLSGAPARLRIADIGGREVFSIVVPGSIGSVSVPVAALPNLAPGIYNVHLESGGLIDARRVVILR